MQALAINWDMTENINNDELNLDEVFLPEEGRSNFSSRRTQNKREACSVIIKIVLVVFAVLAIFGVFLMIVLYRLEI